MYTDFMPVIPCTRNPVTNCPKNVAPGESVDLIVDGKTSGLKGEKSATWVITNKDGVNFYAFTITLKFTGKEATAVNPTDLPLKLLCCDNAPYGVEPSQVCQDWRDFDIGEATMKEACTSVGRPYNGPDVP